MAHSLVLVLLSSVVTQIKANSFLGSSMSFSLGTESHDGSFEVSFYSLGYRNQSCEGQLSWQCQSGDCGTLVQSDVLTKEANAGAVAWCQSETFMTRNVSTKSPFSLRDSGCCWMSNVHGAREWVMNTVVEVGKRTDTHMPNRSPVSATVPRLRIPQNCFQSIELLAHDPDSDDVRCRFSAEAGRDCSSCHTHPNISLNQELCVLHGNGSLSVGTHVFEMVLEDYPTEDITIVYTDGTSSVKHSFNKTAMSDASPLSQIPLQFTVEVLSPVESCVTGVTRPHFLTPTPSHEEVHIIAVGHKHRMTLQAQSTKNRIIDFQISGPRNMSKSVQRAKNGITAATVEWTPQQSDLHRSVPVCFTADTETSQSEMRCVVLMVTQSSPLAGRGEVSCQENIISILVSKASIPGIDHRWLHMKDPSCSLTSNHTHVMGTISINTCGTEMKEEGDFIIFSNAVTSFDAPGAVITRRGQIMIEFSCYYPKLVNVYSHFLNKKSDYIFTESSFGSFSYNFEVFTDSTFTSAVAPESYPVEYELLDMIFMGIRSHSSLPNTKLFVESCRATPTDNPRSANYFDLISNGCLKDETIKLHPSVPTTFNFEVQAFKFSGEYDEVFITCSVVLCEASNPNSRCAQGCLNDISRRRKRSSGLETASHSITQGPIHVLRDSQHRSGKRLSDGSKTASSWQTTTQTHVSVLVVGSLLVASLVLLVVVVVYRYRRYRTLSQQNLLF